jgi:hypothetical protein
MLWQKKSSLRKKEKLDATDEEYYLINFKGNILIDPFFHFYHQRF